MSRHTLSALKATHDVVVGWDRPMGTFFAQVTDLEAPDEDGDLIVWIGATCYGEVVLASKVIEAVRSYAVIPASLQATLEAEQEASRLDPEAMSNAVRDWKKPTPAMSNAIRNWRKPTP